ncbi:MAG TPA: hypothetical protein VD973_06010 [Symbiobacteriaceae bacterium]|nr:hypothetical protein [Symbiobacteriaceae bacterium]
MSDVEPMQEVADRLRRLEDRLERLLASGWRNAWAEAAALAAEGEALAEAGLPGLGERLAQVAAATGSAPASDGDALPALAMALAATRLLRARLPADAPPPGAWAPLSAPAPGARKRTSAPPDRVVPVCRVPHAEGELWACVRLRGAHAEELLLLQPTGERRPWLRHALEGSLCWQARHPLGASGDYQVCTAVNHTWADLEPDALLLVPNDPRKDQLIFSGGGGLRLVQLAPDDLNVYAWLHPAMMEAARTALQHSQWALAWVEGALVAPLALLIPGGLFRRSKLVHLVPGAPAEAL